MFALEDKRELKLKLQHLDKNKMVILGRSYSLLSVDKNVTLTSAKICVHTLTFAQYQERFILFQGIYFRPKKS